MELVRIPSTGLLQPQPGSAVATLYKVAWRSSDDLVATVNQRGIVTGRRKGTATIFATIRGGMGHGIKLILQSQVRVGPVVASLQGIPSIDLLQYCAKRIGVRPVDSTGNPLNDRPVTWQSDSLNIVSINPRPSIPSSFSQPSRSRPTEEIRTAADEIFFHQSAVVFGGSSGEAHITAKCEDATKTISIIVEGSTPTSLRINPSHLKLDVQILGMAEAVILNREDCRDRETTVTWEIDDPTIAQVAATNQQICSVLGLKAGTTGLRATITDGLTTSINVEIPAVAAINLDPTIIPELDIGDDQKQRITATPVSLDGVPLANREVAWDVSGDCLSLNALSGYTQWVTGQHPGSAIVIAKCVDKTATTAVTVPSVSILTIEPPSASIGIDDPQRLDATPYSLSGRPLNNRPIAWEAMNDRVTFPDPPTGITTTVKGKHPGDVRIVAECEEVVGTANIHVKCSGASLIVDWQLDCLKDNWGYCFTYAPRIQVDIENIHPEDCAENLNENASRANEGGRIDCNQAECKGHVIFSFSSLKPGTWIIRASDGASIIERTIYLSQSGEEYVHIN